MKKIITLALVLLYQFSFAQTGIEKDNKKEYKWGCAVAINSINGQMGFPGGGPLRLDENGNLSEAGNVTSKSISLSIIPKYFITNDFLLRFEFAMTKINQQQADDFYSQGGRSINNEKIKQNTTRLVPAIQWNYIKRKFFEGYSGISLIYMNYGKYSYEQYSEYTDSASNDLIAWTTNNSTIEGGFGTGIGAFTGFNIYLQKHISLGAEFSSSYLYYKIGGEYILNASTQSLPNPIVTTLSNNTWTYKGFRFSNILSSFNIAIWF